MLTQESNPYTPPTADLSLEGVRDDTYAPDMLSFGGRIGRCRYLAYSAGLLLLLVVFAVILQMVAGSSNPFFQPVFWYIPLAIITLSMAVRRLNDLHRPGWWAVLLLVPLVNLAAWLWLAIAPGDANANDYGPAPAPNSWPVIAGACLMPMFMLVIVATLAAEADTAYRHYTRATAVQQNRPPLPDLRPLPMPSRPVPARAPR